MSAGESQQQTVKCLGLHEIQAGLLLSIHPTTCVHKCTCPAYQSNCALSKMATTKASKA